MQNNVLVVEDNETQANLLTTLLDSIGMTHEVVTTGEEGIDSVKNNQPDLVILDFELPGISGQEVCRAIRDFSNVYILMLTARADEIDKVMSLSLGADDYVTKPFAPRELTERIRALLRRPRVDASSASGTGGSAAVATIDTETLSSQSAAANKLTQTEMKIASVLLQASPAFVSRTDLVYAVWEVGVGSSQNHVVDVHISNLRKKLKKLFPDHAIENDRGNGFRLVRSA